MSAEQPDATGSDLLDRSSTAVEPGRESSILAALCDPARPALPFRAAVVVAHPDDETIGCGAQLSRFSDVGIIHVTDGAPRDGVDARRLGFSGPDDYAAARRAELENAIGLAGLSPDRLLPLRWPDQQATANLPAIVTELTGILEGVDVVLTHAFEGGHPDHDATALAVHAACARLRRQARAPEIIEMPLYRAGPEGMAAQSFAPISGARDCIVHLDWDAQGLKQAMYGAYASQHDVLLLFSVDTERFRAAPHYDFSEPPNGGDILYERCPWGMTGARWQELARPVIADFGQALLGSTAS